LESTVSAGHWCSRSTRAAMGFADRKNIRRFWSLMYNDDDPWRIVTRQLAALTKRAAAPNQGNGG
jgi:hypothetical protein